MDNKAEDVNKFVARSPLLFALIYFAISFCLNTVILLIGQHATAVTLIGFIAIVMQSLLALGTLVWLGWLRSAGFNGPAQWRTLYLFWLPALLALIYIASALVTPLRSTATLLLASVYALLTGLNEEANYRGVIVRGLSPYRPLVAAALSALFFGLSHLNNLLAHLQPQIVLGQIVGGFLLGFGFAACRLRTRTIWPLILFHALYDLPAIMLLFDTRSNTAIYAMLAQTSTATIFLSLIAPGFILACYGLILLRPRSEVSE